MPDTSRRRIREAVVQFLYAVSPVEELSGTPDESVLALLLEPLREKHTRARAKAVLHLQQGRDKLIAAFPPLLRTLARLEMTDEDGELGRAIRTWDKQETALQESLDAMRHEMNGNKDPKRLRESLESARLSNRASLVASARVSAVDAHFTALQLLRKDALTLRESLALLAERLEAALTDPSGDLPELKAVRKAESEIVSTSARIERYLEGLRSHLPAIDQHLASAVDNYTPERLNRVDRAILRLATYELLFDDDIPPAVAIDEAIELARSFGTTESPKFVNGILDRLRKDHD